MSGNVILINNAPPVVVQSRSQVVIVRQVPGVGPPGPAGGSDAAVLVASHELDPTPHAAYDDLPDLSLLFANGLV